jgi:transposase InsO family protein
LIRFGGHLPKGEYDVDHVAQEAKAVRRGWAVSAVNDRDVTIKALEMALKRRCPDACLLHYSDQGSTCASEDYQAVLEANGITCSMSRRGNCYDNAGAHRRPSGP